jgi:hypothetical protein
MRAWSGLADYLMRLIKRAAEPDGDAPATPQS